MSANIRKKVLDRHPIEWWTTPLGFRKDGRPIFPIAGGDDSDDEDGSDDTDDGGDQGGTDDDDDADDGAADGDGDDGDNGELTDAERKLEARLAKRLEDGLTKATDRIADRLVNAEETRRRKAARKKAQQQGGTGSGGDGGSGGGTRPTASALRDQQQQLDVREARTAYREYVSDGFSFESSAEREAGQLIARAVIEKEIGDGGDPDDAGKAAADEVRKVLKEVRANAEKAVRARLIKEGVIKPGDKDKAGAGKGQQANKGPRSPGDSAAMAKGAAKAKELLPGRFPQQTGTT